MDPVTSEYNKLLRVLLDHEGLRDYEEKAFKDILIRNRPYHSAKQKAWYLKVSNRLKVYFDDPEAADQLGPRSTYQYSHCGLEHCGGGKYYIHDAKGKRYGKPGPKAELALILPWFNQVLKDMESAKQQKPTDTKPTCPF